jgi:polysaccharide pyruvyl transferase WcaK-like protein
MPIAYSRKFAGIWEDLGLGRCVSDPREEQKDVIISRFDVLLREKDDIRKQLQHKVPQVKAQIREMINSFS